MLYLEQSNFEEAKIFPNQNLADFDNCMMNKQTNTDLHLSRSSSVFCGNVQVPFELMVFFFIIGCYYRWYYLNILSREKIP